MKFDIDDKVIVRFSEERKDSDRLFRMADGEFATVVERYTQAHIPNVFFYEVELEQPVEISGERIVLLSGLLEKELEKIEPTDERKINPKYLTKNAKAMKDEIKKHAHKDSADASAYTSHPDGGWKADYDKSGNQYKTKTSSHTKKFKEMFGESVVNESQVDTALTKKAEKTGISKTILKKVYNRGLAAWRTGHRPGVTQHQWAMARVNSFATKGKGTWGKADKDLAQKVRKTNEGINWGSDNKYTWDPQDEAQIFDKKVKYLDIDIWDAPTTFPEEVQKYLDEKYPDSKRLVDLGLSKGFTLESIRPESCSLKYWMAPVYSNYGIDGIEVIALRVYLAFTLEIWNNDEDDNIIWDDEIEIIDDRGLMDVGKVEYSIENGMPIEFNSIEVYMGKSWNPAEFTYKIKFGE
jgi:hypothetical protein